MIETITTLVIPSRLEELFILLTFLAIWIYYFGIKEETKLRVTPSVSIMTTVYTVLILSAVMSLISFAIVNMVLTYLGGLLL